MYSHSHAYDDIEDKGILLGYDSLINEPLHGPLKDSYLLRTNFKNVDAQVYCLYLNCIQVTHLKFIPDIAS